jgi:hypothetical protein
MQTLGVATPEPKSDAKDAPKPTGFGHALLMGGGLVGGGTVVFSAFELIRSEPEKAFHLLHDWGPWCFLAMAVTFAISKIANRGLDVAETFGVRIADTMDRVAVQLGSQAEAMQAQAVAQQKSADKDDRNLQEMQTLTSLTAQRSEKSFTMMQQFHEDNQLILQQQQKSLDRIEAKVDQKNKEAEKSQT